MSHQTRRSAVGAFLVALVGAFLVTLEMTKINVAIPVLVASLGLTPVQTQCALAGFILAAGLSLIPFGRLGDQESRRLLLALGMAVYVAGSLVSAVATGGWVLVIGRVITGSSTGLIVPLAVGLAQQEFTGHARVRAFAAFGVSLAVANALGPVISGMLLEFAPGSNGWRLLFLTNVPVGAIVAVAALIWVPGRPTAVVRRRMDGVGVLLLAVAALLVMFPFVLTSGRGVDWPWRWLALPVGILVAAAFARWEMRLSRAGGQPIVSAPMARNRPFRSGILIGAGWFGSTPGLLLLVSVHAQTQLGERPLIAGLLVAPFAAAAAFGSWLVSLAPVGEQTRNRLLSLGLVVGIAGVGVTAISSAVAISAAVWIIAAGQTIAGVGGGLTTTYNQINTLVDVPQDRGGNAAAVQQLSQRLAAAIGLAIIVSAYVALSNSDLAAAAFPLSLLVVAAMLFGSLVVNIRSADIRSADAVELGPQPHTQMR